MRRKDKEIKDINEIEEIIRSASVCRLGLSLDDVPYIVPFNYGYKDGCLYFHSAKEGKKIDILNKNPKICFEIDIDGNVVKNEKPCDWSMKYKSVIGFGEAKIIQDSSEKRQALSIIMSHYTVSTDFEFNDKAIDNVFVIKVDIESMTGKKSGY